MKYTSTLLITFLIVFISSCSTETENYGAKISNPSEAKNISELPNMLSGKDSVNVVLTGDVASVCKSKGCWMNLKMSEDQTATITFKDYAFFVPMNCEGKTAIVEGVAFVDTVSVAERKHLAQDAKKTDEEIAAITTPEIKYTVKASGVELK